MERNYGKGAQKEKSIKTWEEILGMAYEIVKLGESERQVIGGEN